MKKGVIDLVINVLIIIGGILLITFNFWYRLKLKKLKRRSCGPHDEAEVKDGEISEMKKMLYLNFSIAIITVTLTIIQLVKLF